MADESERRKDVRARISLPTTIVRRGALDEVEMIDASYRGMFLRVDDPPPIRQMIKVRVKLPARMIEVHGVVVRIVEDSLGRSGVGLRFFALNGQDRADWETFISSLIQKRTWRAA